MNCNLVKKIALVTGKSNGNLVTKMTTATVGTLVTLIIIIMSFMYLGKKVKLSHYWPGVALRVPGS